MQNYDFWRRYLGRFADRGTVRDYLHNTVATVSDFVKRSQPIDAVAIRSEFIRRFLIHTLPQGFHRIRHYGLFAIGGRKAEAQRQAMMALVDEGDYRDATGREVFSYAHPIFWGPFTIVGDNNHGPTS